MVNKQWILTVYLIEIIITITISVPSKCPGSKAQATEKEEF